MGEWALALLLYTRRLVAYMTQFSEPITAQPAVALPSTQRLIIRQSPDYYPNPQHQTAHRVGHLDGYHLHVHGYMCMKKPPPQAADACRCGKHSRYEAVHSDTCMATADTQLQEIYFGTSLLAVLSGSRAWPPQAPSVPTKKKTQHGLRGHSLQPRWAHVPPRLLILHRLPHI